MTAILIVAIVAAVILGLLVWTARNTCTMPHCHRWAGMDTLCAEHHEAALEHAWDTAEDEVVFGEDRDADASLYGPLTDDERDVLRRQPERHNAYTEATANAFDQAQINRRRAAVLLDAHGYSNVAVAIAAPIRHG